MDHSISTFRIIYDAFLLIYKKKITILLFVLGFTITGIFINHFKIISEKKEHLIVVELSSNTVNPEIITGFINSINEMSVNQKMTILNLPLAEAKSLKLIQTLIVPLTPVNNDLYTRSIVRLLINYSDAKHIEKSIDKIFFYLKSQEIIIKKLNNFNTLLGKKKQLLQKVNHEIERLDKNELSLNDFLEYDNISTIELFKFKLRLENEVLDSASLVLINKGVSPSPRAPEAIDKVKIISTYSLLGFALSMVFIYITHAIAIIKKEKQKTDK